MKKLYGLLSQVTLLSLLFSCLSPIRAQDITFTAVYGNSLIARIVKVGITSPWTDTGMDLAAGGRYGINIEGIASTDGATVAQDAYWYDAAGGYQPAGSSYPLPGAPIWSIIGRIGTSGTPFYVGTVYTFSANKSGRLFLGFNDTNFPDNAGYYIAFINGSPLTDLPGGVSGLPFSFVLGQNYPNPFNPSTTIQYALPSRSHITLAVYNTLGQIVRELVNGDMGAGYQEVQFDAGHLASGVYLYRMQAGNFVEVKKLVVLK
jgi:hypothetical protein